MSETASRYIGGVPYGPGRSVGRYPSRASILTGPTAPSDSGLTAPVNFPLTDGTGIAFNPANGTVTDAGVSGGGGGGGGNALLLSALLGALSYAPDAYDAISRLLGPSEANAQTAPTNDIAGGSAPGGVYVSGDLGAGTAFPTGARFITGPGGNTVTLPPGAVQGIDGVVELPGGGFYDGTSYLDMPALASDLPAAPIEGGSSLGALETPMTSVADRGGVTVGSAPADSGFNWANPLGVRTGLEDTLGTLGGVDVATSLANAGAGLAGAYATRGLAGRSPENQLGATVGSTLGGILGGALLGPVGAFAGAAGGGALGGQVGAQPTIGRNFGVAGTFNPDGSISWGGAGGDNGGTAEDAQGAANWLTPTLNSLAQQYGYAFNPAAAGGQIRIGGYNSFDRNIPGGVGGMFYDVQGPGGQFGGSPERYTLRPAQSSLGTYGGWDGGSAFTDQGYNAYANNVLADLVARGVYTPGGQNSQTPFWGGQDTYGFYNSQDPFSTTLANRQSAIGGALAQQQRAAELNNREGTPLTLGQLQSEFQYLPQFNQYQAPTGQMVGNGQDYIWQGGIPVPNAPAADAGAPVEMNTWQNN